MRANMKGLAVALAAVGLATAFEAPAAPAQGDFGGARHGGRGGNWSGRHWDGGHRNWSGRHWNGGHRHWGGHSHWNWGLSIGVPLAWGAWGWGYPYYGYYYDYPRETIIYREVERVPELIEPAAEVRPSEGAPSQGPLYMNYCESAKAYFPKVTTCPEGWKLATPTR